MSPEAILIKGGLSFMSCFNEINPNGVAVAGIPILWA